jgi:uncharacterized protein
MSKERSVENSIPGAARAGEARATVLFPERQSDGHDGVLAFLADPASYPGHPSKIEAIETHMSRVFLAGDRVYKIKKALRFPFVDFTSLEQRRLNCLRELELNQTLAPDVYLDVLPIAPQASGALAIGGEGEPVEWLIVMRRLERAALLDNALRNGTARPDHADQLAGILARFYRGTPRIGLSGEALLGWWRDAVSLTARSLTDPFFSLPAKSVEQPLGYLQRFLATDADAIAARAPFVLDGHGDLRPEHVHLGPPIRLIDRLEFSARLRWADPYDEAVFLGMECERLGAPWFGPRVLARLSGLLGEAPPAPLLQFYRCYRACLRARLSIEHLLDSSPRTPERWPAQARDYLGLALASPACGESLQRTRNIAE